MATWYRFEPWKYAAGPIAWWAKLTPWFWFANEDDPTPPYWYEPTRQEWDRRIRFRLRNAGHNVGFYILGTADRPSWRWGRFPNHIWADEGRWNWSVSFLYGWLPAPFVSYQGSRVEWYVGFRESGNFGVALRRSRS